MKNDMEIMNEWADSIDMLLRSVDHDQSCSISIVPEQLKNSSNEDAYIPRVVSIGPRFKGSREDLLLMEEVKVRSMLSLLRRAGKGGETRTYLQKCSQSIWRIDDQIRACYVSEIKLDKNELSKIMLVDGCFLLELMIAKGLDSQLPSRLNPPGPAAELLKNEDVLSDIMLLENQIPMLVLHRLCQNLFPNVFISGDRNERLSKLNNLVLSVLGYTELQNQTMEEAPHFLYIVHFFVNNEKERHGEDEEEQHHVVVNIIDTQTQQQQSLGKIKLNRCALRLLTAGVTIKAKQHDDKDSIGFDLCCFNLVWKSLCGMLFRLGNILLVNGKHLDLDLISEEVELKGLDFYFQFQKDKLEIEQLHITKTTKAKWCNLIAWEHRQRATTKGSSGSGSGSGGSSDGGKFTWAALIFNGLICCADDVQLLKDKKIVVDHLKMNNQELVEFFQSIAFGVDHKVVDSSNYIQMVDDMNNYAKAFFMKRIWKTVWNSFTYRQEWIIRFMNRNYNFVATVLSVLTVVQTVYAILPYYFPK